MNSGTLYITAVRSNSRKSNEINNKFDSEVMSYNINIERN